MTKHSRFSITLPINYEDTDAGGVVYYANYLAYMERARNACLRHVGFPLSQLQQQHGVVFVVVEAHLNYVASARLDDEIEVTVEKQHIGRVHVVFRQQVLCRNQVLVNGKIKLAVVDCTTFRPCRIPVKLAHALR